MVAKSRLWDQREIEQAINLYIEIPFGKIDRRTPQIIKLAHNLGRTPSSISLKLSNLASLDETLDRKGMSNASKLDKEVWSNFFQKLLMLGKTLDETSTNISEPSFQEIEQASYELESGTGSDIFSISTKRQGQEKFRKIILANYNSKCAVSEINQSELLIAGHISPWAKDPDNRLNPRNGILLNRLHDKAFEDGLITFEENGKTLFSNKLETKARNELIKLNPSGYLSMPVKFKPDPFLLGQHREFHLQKGNLYI